MISTKRALLSSTVMPFVLFAGVAALGVGLTAGMASKPAMATCNPCAAKKKKNPCATAKNPCAAAKCNPCAAACNPCNPCAAKKCNPCAAKCNPCNPCAAKGCNPCNPCAAKGCNPCNPCAAKGCNPCNPCAAGACNPCNPCGAGGGSASKACYVPRLHAAACNPCNPCAAKKCNPCAAKGCNPCNPCAAKACNPCNPCAAKGCNPCNPCAAKACNPCNPCAAKGCNPCNPCAAKACNPCNPCNPCAAGACNPCNPCGAGGGSAELTDAEAVKVYDCLLKDLKAAYAKSGNKVAVSYSSWPRYSKRAYVSDTHGGRFVQNYANKKGRAYGAFENAGTFPAGTALAKDSFAVSGKGKVTAGPLFIMEKMRAGFNSESGDWRYTMVMPNGSVFGTTKGKGAGNVEFCIGCHISVAPDQDSVMLLPEEYRVR